MSIDTLFVNGSVWSAGMTGSRPGALAVSSGRIAAIGTDDEVSELAGPSTEVVDLGGRAARCRASRTRTCTR